MNFVAKAIMAGFMSLSMVLPAAAESQMTAPGDSKTGTYADYMKTVYARAGQPELTQIPLTTFDKDYTLTPMAAESWEVSDDGLTWTFHLQPDLVWSDGEPLTAGDYIFALKRAATEGYDFAWYWDFAGGIANWKAVTEGEKDVDTLGIKAVDDHTISVTTATPKPYLPSVVSLWYPVPEHQWDKYGDDWAVNVDTLLASGPFKITSWEKSNNSMMMEKNPDYHGPWQAKLDKLYIDSDLGAPEVGMPAYLAGETDWTSLNAGQIPFAEKRFPDQIRKNAVFAVSYISFDLDSAPFNNVDVRKALWYAINRDEMTQTVLKNLAIPGRSLLAPGYPGYSQKIADLAVFDPDKARDYLARAGYPGGKGFPEIEIWYREQGGYNGAITPPMLQYLQAQFKKELGITMKIRVMPINDWMDALLNKKNNLFLAPYEYDYLDPSNFFGLFYTGGRHGYEIPRFDTLIKQADAGTSWDERVKLYEQAEEVLIDEAAFIPLVHPITVALVSDKLSGEGVEPNKQGFTPLNRLAHYFYTHIEKQ
ncbi:peptide ABC transporter substrate-binding protein [Martelella sp. HB161492]|uniref:peptide ABC transporter substrate-binding protein n=1 Tax=Martelella sp. HB161492 TaxID=2720726 RepID=UPI0015914C95|nr:peptide ABC transporter substrate-binding protein [Martelella sp. HB161492]